MRPFLYLLAGLFFLPGFFCSCRTEAIDSVDHYRFFEPDTILVLDKKLKEISSIEYIDSTTLMGICDEAGTIYFIHSGTGQVLDQYLFDKQGDYEGLAVKDSFVYALQSDGDIFRLSGFHGDSVDHVEKFKTGLDEDCEGFCYNAERKLFFIACKNRAEGADRMIYSVDAELKTKPKKAFPLYFRTIKNRLLTNSYDRFAFRLRKMMTSTEEAGILGPSGLEIHPKTKKYYLLSGTSSLVIIMNRTGDVEKVCLLPKNVLTQPEGICFAPDGTLYISSEKGNSTSAKIVKYSFHE